MWMYSQIADLPQEVIDDHFRRPHSDPVRIAQWNEWTSCKNEEDLHYTCAGINHMAFFLSFGYGDRDLYPAVRAAAVNPTLACFDRTRFALCRRLGYYMTESPRHTAEYVPYFLKNKAEMAAYDLVPSSYLDTCAKQDQMYRDLQTTLAKGEPAIPSPYKPSLEHVSRILNAIITGKPFVFNGNVHNRGGALISNLPGDCCVEVPCVADREGIRPTAVGELPPQCAALIRTNVNVQDLTVCGILEGRRDRILQAVMLDPSTAAQISLDAIDELVEAMFQAHAKAGNLPPNLR
jgi:alpha-galactosidase